MIRSNLRSCATHLKPKNRLGSAFLVSFLLTSTSALSAPHALARPETTLYVPSMAALAPLGLVLERAGQHASLLRPGVYARELHPFLQLNFFKPETLAAQGIDTAGSFTLSRKKDVVLSCLALSDVAAFHKEAKARIAPLGEVWTKKVAGLTRVGARDVLRRDLAGYVTDGKTACAVQGQGGIFEQDFVDASKALKTVASGGSFGLLKQLKGAAYSLNGSGGLAFSAPTPTTLAFEGLSFDARTANLPRTAQHVFAGGGASDSLLTAVANIAEADLPRAVSSLGRTLHQVVPAEAGPAVDAALAALGPTLAGPVAALTTKLEPSGPLRTRAGQFFAVRGAAVALVKDAPAARLALETFVKAVKGRTVGDGYEWQVPAGRLFFGLEGTRLYFSNDAAALANLRARPFAPGTLNAGLRARLALPKLAEGLSRIPLLEAVTTPELAGLLAIATELGPLFDASDELNVEAESAGAGTLRFHGRWNLKSVPAPVLDAGP